MPENPDNQEQPTKQKINQELPVRELTQTDRLNKRLLEAFLQQINSDPNNPFNQIIRDQSEAADQVEEPQDFNDPDDLEQVIEGEDNENQGNGEAEEDNTENDKQGENKVEPKKKRATNPQPKLNEERLKGPRGMGIVETFFKDIKLRGKGHEKEDLDIIMRHLEHWAHRLFPRYTFDDCLERIEKLGVRRPIQNYLKRIRLGMEDDMDPMSLDQREELPPSPPTVDPFDELIGNRPSQTADQPVTTLTSEQRERMLRNRLIAEERKLARMKAQQEKQRLENESNSEENGIFTNLSTTTTVHQSSTTEEQISRLTDLEMNTDVSTAEKNIPLADHSLNSSFEERTESCGMESKNLIPDDKFMKNKRRQEGGEEGRNKMARLESCSEDHPVDVVNKESRENIEEEEKCFEINESTVNRRSEDKNEQCSEELTSSDGSNCLTVEKETTNADKQFENADDVKHFKNSESKIGDDGEAIHEDLFDSEKIHKDTEPYYEPHTVSLNNSDLKEIKEFEANMEY